MDPVFVTETDRDHLVQFYDDEAGLISEVGRAMCIALDQGAAVVCIATDTHRRRLERHLVVCGIDVDEVRNASQFVCLDARATLARVVQNGVPDVVQFAGVIGDVVNRVAAKFPRVWIFGELVALMCANGHYAGAAELEKIWASFMTSRPFIALHCAYPTAAFKSEEDRRAFVQICQAHCRVLHSDSSLTIALN